MRRYAALRWQIAEQDAKANCENRFNNDLADRRTPRRMTTCADNDQAAQAVETSNLDTIVVQQTNILQLALCTFSATGHKDKSVPNWTSELGDQNTH